MKKNRNIFPLLFISEVRVKRQKKINLNLNIITKYDNTLFPLLQLTRLNNKIYVTICEMLAHRVWLYVVIIFLSQIFQNFRYTRYEGLEYDEKCINYKHGKIAPPSKNDLYFVV